MNPQYLPPQQVGGPPQQFSGPPQGFPPNRTSPVTTNQTFQNIPLGPQKPPQGDHGPPPPMNIGKQTPRSQIPSSQLLPSNGSDSSGPFNSHPSKNDPNMQNGPPTFQNGPPQLQFQNGQLPGQLPPTSQPNRPPSNFAALQSGQNQFGAPTPNLPPRPPSNQSNQLPAGLLPPFGQQSPPLGPPLSQTNQPSSQFSQSSVTGAFSGSFPPKSVGSVPPVGSGNPPYLSQPPLLGGAPPSQLDGPPSQLGGPPSQLGGPPSQLGGPPSQLGGPPSQLGGPNSQLGGPSSHLGGPPSQMGGPQSQLGGHLSQSGGPPSQFGGPPLQSGVPSLPPGSFPSVNGPNQPSSNQFGPPPGIQSHFSSQMGPPKPGGQFPPQSKQGQPPLPGQNVSGQSPFQNVSGPYPPATQMPPPLPGQSTYVSNQLSNQMQGISLTGPNKYPTPPGAPGVPVRGGMNGDSGPHMPPPVNQAGFINGQQARGPPGPGYPPMPGQPPLPGQGPMPGQGQYPVAPGGYPQPNYQQPQQNRRLDPDQMPSPIQVTQDDQQNRSGVFVTNQKGLVPPLVTTNFIVQDQGNCSPRFIRSSMYNVPVTQDIVKQTAVPFSLVISPMARLEEQEFAPPIVNFGTLGPVRCIRCKAYMCPFMQFVDSGRRFQCLFCMATTDVPTEYFQHLDHTGQRMDRYERPELILGTYEFVATSDYCRNNTLPKPPAIIFVIDVSYNNIKSGLVNLLCSQMKEIIQNLPVDQGQEKSNMRVGFITYNSSVHFYNIKGTLAAPQMLVVGDVQEMFMPLLDGFLCTPEESGPVIDLLMQQIPAMFGDTRETETVFLPAIQAGLEALKAYECVGKLLVFHSTLPSAEAPGKLKNRDDRKVLGTDKEKTVLTPQTQAYNQLGQECVGAGCSVDLFVFNNSYIDLATIGQVSRLTGGEVFKYTYFQADLDGERVLNDIIMDINRPKAFDAVMRVRTSTGVRPTDFYGHFYMSNTTDIELAAVDCDKAIGVEIKHDDKLSEEAGVYIQAALLYTSCSGQRRLRIMNLSLKTCSQMADLYRSCDLDTVINYISKQACYKLLDNNPKAVKDAIVNRAAQILATYRKNCASPSSAGQLILPECMKLLPLYVNCLLKNDALSGGSDMTIDDRSFVMQAVMIMDVPTSVHYFYPRLIPIHDIDVSKEPITIPSPIRCTIDKMNEQGVYILENGIHMFLWIGLCVNPDFIQKLFGAPSAIQVDIDRAHLPELDNPISIAVRNIIDEIRVERHRYMRLTLVRQREKLEPVFKHFLIEDRGNDGSPSYVDFLCHMHKEIRNLLS